MGGEACCIPVLLLMSFITAVIVDVRVDYIQLLAVLEDMEEGTEWNIFNMTNNCGSIDLGVIVFNVFVLSVL